MRRNKVFRGSAPVVAIVVVLLLAFAGAGFWFYYKAGNSGNSRDSAFALADHLPKASKAVWLLNLKGQLDSGQLKSDWEDIAAKLPAEQKENLEQELKMG